LRLETVVFDRNGAFYPGEYDLDPAPVAVKRERAKSSGGTSTHKRRNSQKVRHSIPNVRPTASQRLARV
jgi:hypothetical protein